MKKLTKPHLKNVRLEKPCGLLGVPPDATIKIYAPAGTVVIVTDKPVYKRRKNLPQ